jgi:hypothetical protein
VVFPIEREGIERQDDQPAHNEPPSPFFFGLVCVLRLLPLVFVATALIAFFIFDVLKGNP